MTARTYRIRLIDIRQEIAGIRELTKDADAESFAASWAMKRAVEHALLIIAEAAKHIPSDVKDTRREIPWAKIHGLANMLRHEYRHIDPHVLWSIITDQIEPLDRAIVALIDGT